MLNQLNDEYNNDFNDKTKSIEEIKKWYNSIKKEYPAVELKIYEYETMPLFGASFVDYKKKGGFIHFSQYLPGLHQKGDPYIEVEWNTEQEPPLFKTYSELLRNQILPNLKSIY